MRGPNPLVSPLSYCYEGKMEKTLINLRKAENDDMDALK